MYINDELLDVLRERMSELGRVPMARDMRKPDHNTYLRRFGSWNEALELAGLPIIYRWQIKSVVGRLRVGAQIYVACAIDTDGSIQVKKGIANVANNHKGFLENIQRMCNGAGRIHIYQGWKTENINYRLVFRKSETLDVLSQVVSYLIIKKDKALEVLKKGKKRRLSCQLAVKSGFFKKVRGI